MQTAMFDAHRKALMARMGDAVAVFFAAPELIRNRDVHHAYRQESDFFFLTGFEEPESVLVLAPQRDEGDRVVLFVRERDPDREVWDGERLGVERAPEVLGVDKAYPIGELGERLPEYLKGAARLYHALGRHDPDDRAVLAAIRRARTHRKHGHETPGDVCDPEDLLHELRLRKSDAAIDAMRRAARLTGIGHRRAMAIARPGLFEYQLQAAMEYEWAVRGARRTAYESIVGSGPNACVLHYRANDRRMRAGDLVLIDAGCEVDYHASDVTRTFPVDGRFTPEQRAVYEVVLAAQKQAIERCRPGHTFDSVHQAALRVLVEGMLELGLLKGTADQAIEEETYKRYYMHRTGHWIGMDVHDVGRYYLRGTSRALEPGMALTVEPGLYIPPGDEEAPEPLRGIGVRVEDDVLITAAGPEVLTADIPKEIAELEALVGTAELEAAN